MKPWLSKRSELGVYNTLLQELRLEGEFEYKKFLKMVPSYIFSVSGQFPLPPDRFRDRLGLLTGGNYPGGNCH